MLGRGRPLRGKCVSKYKRGPRRNWEGRDTRTGFSFAVERGEGCEGGEQDAEIGERHE